ncbi:hypothetical protein AB0O07_28890 [Streptomyces sp. NPDC093085]|uniref:hypothetical protein n=1 Tax=Streptomyces sp. NPDC093085 TaxID=3155068 RepID=UPI003438B55C
MNGRHYNVTVVCEGPINGTWVRVLLAARQTTSPEHALTFLRAQARRIANGLDPQPHSGWIPDGTLTLVAARTPDASTGLRFWCHNPAAQKAARERLAAGGEFVLGAIDDSGLYLLRALPVPAYVPLPAYSSLPTRGSGAPGHRKPRWFERLRLRLRPWWRRDLPDDANTGGIG